VDDYQREISDLQAEIDRMVEAEEDQKEIAELEMQLEILRALYDRARELQQAGARDPELQRRLKLRGYGEWTLDNVYAFVYETSVDLPGGGHQAFVGGIRESDFAGALRDAEL
jgi:predicted translin family RNA/ssDNA-binding protein